MYHVTKIQWQKILRDHPDFVTKVFRRHEHGGKVCNTGDYACFECLLPGAPNTGCVLVFEHIHFEIVLG